MNEGRGAYRKSACIWGRVTVKATLGLAIALLCLAANAHAAELQACDLGVDIVDQDPKGTNVRESPGGKVVAVLKLGSGPQADDWIEVHVAGQSGDWLLIDGAEEVGDERKVIFRGRGYVHRSVLGASGLQGGSKLLSDPAPKSPLLAAHPLGDQPVQFLGCRGPFAHVHVKEGAGWTRALCLNQRTTCV